MIFTQLTALVLSAAFGMLLYLRNLKMLPFDDHLLVFIRLWFFLVLGAVLLIGVIIMRWHRHIRKQGAPLNEGQKNGVSEKGNPAADATAPEARRRWRRFERGFLIFLLIYTSVQIIRFDVFAFIASFGPAHDFISQNETICWVLDRLTEGMFFVLIVYTLLKIPMTVGELLGSFDKLYISHWRIHESVFGILWVIVGGGFIIFGHDGFDRAFGVIYVLLGAFFIGRDYDDVRNLKFIQRVDETENSLK